VFRLCVNELKIAPSEAWKLDLVEVIHLLNQDKNQGVDASIMLNHQRVKNGASKEWLQRA
jgi:hypothetical protein